MAEQAERAFARTFLNTLSTQPVTYADDYQQPPEYSMKRVPVLSISVPPPPERKARVQASSSASISLTFKSLKPPASFTLSVQPTDSISSIKAQLAAQPSAPPAEIQRLLLKGKALADSKLLKEYAINDGDTVNLMIKPGTHWDPTAPATPAPKTPSLMAPAPDAPPSNPFSGLGGSLGTPASGASKAKHQRIPSVVLSPSPSLDAPGAEKDITLTLDASSPTIPSATLSTYHEVVSDPEFWLRMYEFLCREFKTAADMHTAFEDFLCAAKGSLSAFEIAKIRDTVGVRGMAGT
jgi:UV excision repair protein RAD23